MTRTHGHNFSRSKSYKSPHARNCKSKDRYCRHQTRQKNKELLENIDYDEIDPRLFFSAKGTNRGVNRPYYRSFNRPMMYDF